MSMLDGLRHRFTVLIKGEAYADEVRRELRFHRELDSLALDGAPLGNETYSREEVRRMTLMTWLDHIRQDLAYALRGLRRSPGFTIAVILTLGLGVGVNGAMFSLLSRLFVLSPEGVVQPTDVRRIYATFNNTLAKRLTIPDLQYPQFVALRAALDSSIALGIFTDEDSVSVRDDNRRIPTMVDYANPEFFSVLGVRAARGRLFTADEGRIDTPTPVAVLSDAYWHRAFDGAPSAIGRQIKIRNLTVTIVGIAPAGFTGIDIDATDLWLPTNTFPGQGSFNGLPWYRACCAGFHVIVRPRSQSEAQQIAIAGTNAIRPIRTPGFVYDSTITMESGPIVAALGPANQTTDMIVANRIAGVVLFVLVIAGANIMNLLLLRTARRRREIAVRLALGVSRARLFEQIGVEAFVLALGGACVALAFAFWAGAALRRLMLPSVHWANGVLDGRTVAFVVATSIVVAVMSALAPSFEAVRTEVTGTLKASSQRGGDRGSRLRGMLLAIQTALCVVLLVGAGLFLRSLNNVVSIDTGFAVGDRLFFTPTFDDPVAHSTELRTAVPEAVARLNAVDGVSAAAFMALAPLESYSFHTMFLPGHDKLPQLADGERGATYASVSPGYFTAVGLRLVAGRDFSNLDAGSATPVTIVSQRLATLYWPGENPLGKCLMLGARDAPCTQVVGVVSDAHRRSLIERPATQMYVPIAQTTDLPRQIVVQVRPGREVAVTRAAEEILRSLVTELVTIQPRRFADATRRELRPWRLGATLFTALGVLALAVAAIGIYSIVAYGVSQRTHEMGVRIALGADRGTILDLVVGDGLRVVLAGIGSGIIATVLLGRLVSAFLFGVAPTDLSVMTGASTLLLATSVLACLIPAFRASQANPVDALRAD